MPELGVILAALQRLETGENSFSERAFQAPALAVPELREPCLTDRRKHGKDARLPGIHPRQA